MPILQIYSQHIFTEYAYSVNICRVVLSMYLQNAHMWVIRFDLFSQNMIFMPPTSEKLRGHIGLGLSVRPSVRQSDCLSVRNSLAAEKLKNPLC